MNEIKLGIYQHYRGTEYEVIAVAKDTETLEDLIIYKSLEEYKGFLKGTIWARPKDMFCEFVEVNGHKTPRFTLIENKIQK